MSSRFPPIRISPPGVGGLGLENKIAQAFEERGFKVETNVKLGTKLNVDFVATSKNQTYICEVKHTLRLSESDILHLNAYRDFYAKENPKFNTKSILFYTGRLSPTAFSLEKETDTYLLKVGRDNNAGRMIDLLLENKDPRKHWYNILEWSRYALELQSRLQYELLIGLIILVLGLTPIVLVGSQALSIFPPIIGAAIIVIALILLFRLARKLAP